MSELTLHTGFMGDHDTINIDWFDENGTRKSNVLEIKIKNQDKPRVLEIVLDGFVIATVPERLGLPNPIKAQFVSISTTACEPRTTFVPVEGRLME